MIAEVGPGGPVRDFVGAFERGFTEHGFPVFVARQDFRVFAPGERTDIPRFVSRLRQQLQPATAEGL